MIYVLIAFHVIVCLFLIAVVLLQSGKAADLAGAFGGMGSQTTFGPRGSATLLSKATTIAAGVFMVTSLGLAIMETRRAGLSTSVLERTGVSQQKKKDDKKAAPLPVNPAAPSPIQTTPNSPSGVQINPGEPAAPAPTPITPAPTQKTPEPAKK